MDPKLAAAHFIAAHAVSMRDEPDLGRVEVAKCDAIDTAFVKSRHHWQPYRDAASNEQLNAALRELTSYRTTDPEDTEPNTLDLTTYREPVHAQAWMRSSKD